MTSGGDLTYKQVIKCVSIKTLHQKIRNIHITDTKMTHDLHYEHSFCQKVTFLVAAGGLFAWGTSTIQIKTCQLLKAFQ